MCRCIGTVYPIKDILSRKYPTLNLSNMHELLIHFETSYSCKNVHSHTNGQMSRQDKECERLFYYNLTNITPEFQKLPLKSSIQQNNLYGYITV